MLQVLYEDNHLFFAAKPAGLATMGLAEGEETLWTRAKDFLKRKYDKPGNVYLGVVSRLDVPVSGVVLFAKTSKAAARLNEQFRNHTVEKIYRAVVEGRCSPSEGTLTDKICEDERHKKVWVTQTDQGKESRLYYRTISSFGNDSLIEIRLETGRKHQIRVQFGSRGCPILGDRKYGSRAVFSEGIALHARRLTIRHPISSEPITVTAPLPQSWNQFPIEER